MVGQPAVRGVSDAELAASSDEWESSAGARECSACDSAASPSAGGAVAWQSVRGVSDAELTASSDEWENSAGARECSACDSAASPSAGGAVVWQPAAVGAGDAELAASSDEWESSAGARECPAVRGVSDAELAASSDEWESSAAAKERSACDSAESRVDLGVDEMRSGGAGAGVGFAASMAADCARSGRSVLDRLLDEVEAAEHGEQDARDVARAADSAGPEGEAERGGTTLAGSGTRSTAGSNAQPGMLRRRAEAARCAFDRADALVSVASAYLHGDRPQRAPIDVTITIPASSLRKDAVDAVDVGCMGSACISAETARRLSCDAGVVEVIEDEQGVPLSVGRKRSTIAGSIKRALLRRDGACTYPGCANRMFLEGHHIDHWADGGATTLDNAALLCSHHHRFVHEYGYAIELGPDRRPQFRDPHGRVLVAVPAGHCGPDLGWPQIDAANSSLAIDADTIACEWDGKPVRYGRVIDDLVAVDGLV